MALIIFSFLVLILLSLMIICGQSTGHNSAHKNQISFKISLKHRRRSPAPLSKNFYVTGVSYRYFEEYYTTVNIGSPPQPMELNIDTGSSASWVRCFPCQNTDDTCYLSTYFRQQNSRSYSKLLCEKCVRPAKCNDNGECIEEVEYVDNSTATTVMAFETFYMTEDDGIKLMNMEISNVPLGCAIKTNGFLLLDGSLGLGAGNLSFISLLKNNYGVKVFSYCLVDQIKNRGDSSDMIFGEQVPSLDTSYTPMYRNYFSREHFSIILSGIKFKGEALANLSLPIKMIVDTGATVTTVPGPVYNALVDKFLGVADQLAWGLPIEVGNYFPCYEIDPDQISASSTITFNFKGDAELLLLPNNIWHYIYGHDVACFAFMDAARVSKFRVNILGNTQQQGTRVIFNQTDEDLIGFDPYGC